MDIKLQEIKNWNPEIEKSITDKWKSSEKFRIDKNTKKPIYSIDTPPPYVNSPIHIAQAVTYCYMDFFARYKRMKGFDVLFPLGLDRNGLPIEMATEKKFNISPFMIGREKFIEQCEQLINQGSTGTTESFSQLGISFTSYKEGDHLGAVYKTDSPKYRALTQSTFIELYKKGLVYEDTRINNWDPKLQTTIADSEIDYKEIPSTFNDIKWKVKETNEEIIIATTRPELIATCGMIIFNPKDKRYKHLEGKHAISPIFNEEIPIKSHPLADPEKGSGIVMMCSAGDLSDIQFFREQNLTPRIAINKDGTMNEIAGPLTGLKVKQAREKIINLLKEKNLLVKQTQISHRTPISERSKAEIEFIEMPEFYLKQLEFKKEIKKISKKINFFPKQTRKILEDWIEGISIDWPISRRRFYATSIPLWHSKNLTALPPKGEYYIPWKQQPPKDSEIYENGKFIGKIKDFPNEKWEGETRVLDTWMDSSISELYILNYKSDDKFFEKAFPATLRPQGKEIVRTWLYYTILRGYLETKKPCFKEVWIHQHLTDEKGRKMSKSLGNVIDPKDIIKKYGAEALRFWSAIEGDLSKQDLKVSEDRIKAELKTINKILNISKFILQFEKPKKSNLTKLDQLFIDYIENLTKKIDENYSNYDFHNPAKELRFFIWDIFASHYIELVKKRAYNQDSEFSKQESDSAKYTLYFILERMLILISPIIPQITSVIGKELQLENLQSQFPQAKLGKSNLKIIEKIIEFNSKIWKEKKEKGISLRDKISGIKIPKDLEEFSQDLKSCHNL
jgi:valyl-tRNA synthetase